MKITCPAVVLAMLVVGCAPQADTAKTDAEMRAQMVRKPESEMTAVEKEQLAAQRKSNLEMAAKIAGQAD